MKIFLTLPLLISFLLGFSQEIRPELIGDWEAEAFDNRNDTEYYLMIKRFEDGTFDSLLQVHTAGEMPQHFAGSGYWETIENKLILTYFTETGEEIKEELEFEFLNDEEVRIKSKAKNRPKVMKNYVEYKVSR